MKANLTQVELKFLEKSPQLSEMSTKLPYLIVDNFPKLGFLSALRFLEWVVDNPKGVISLPTGKTPEYFIKWTKYIIDHFEEDSVQSLLAQNGLNLKSKPYLGDLKFVQIDEFFPIDSSQQNSFFHYVKEYYIKGFGLSLDNALLMDVNKIPLKADGTAGHLNEIFPDLKVDLSLRYRTPKNRLEAAQQEAIFQVDQWCLDYEQKIRDLGGIGFFLGGIGPDGHIAFNTLGSSHYSTTRLTETNFETQAVAAGDLGGIEISKNRLVITIGLGTITYNQDATAIIFAAGEAKASIVKHPLESEPTNIFPATVLQALKMARFYITEGAASLLEDEVMRYYQVGGWTQEKTERAVIKLCQKLGKFGSRLTLDDLKNDPFCRQIPDLSENTVKLVQEAIIDKIDKGMKPESNQRYYHTGPHHDDVMLGILPHVHRLLRDESNHAEFSVLTSGFTAVTNTFIIKALEETKRMMEQGLIQMIKFPDFFISGYKYKWDKDVYHFLSAVAAEDQFEQNRGLSHRVVRAVVAIFEIKDEEELFFKINGILSILRNSYDGQKNPPNIQQLKGMVREFEEELVWAHFGVQVKKVHHLRLGFYTGDIFTEQPEKNRDVMPILEQLRKIKPTVLSLALDPEGSGPDTHYKVLQAIAAAVRLWAKEEDLSDFRIWGYRNVWYRFSPSEANVMVPVSLNAMATLDASFEHCYLTQVEASFPSYMYDGKFSKLAQKIWVEQMEILYLLLGKDFFYQNESPRLRASHGMLFFREMNVEQFLVEARRLEKSMEGLVL